MPDMDANGKSRSFSERAPEAPEPGGPAAPRRQRSRWAVPALLAVIVFAVFFPVLSADFVNWDDDANFLENMGYRGLSLTHLRWMVTTFHMGNYQPLTWLSLGIDYELWGMNPGGYHLSNLLLHVASTILFYLFLRALLLRLRRPGEGGPSERPRWPAALGALFFAVHPLRVESVAWATERKDVLCVFFVMLTLLAYLRMEALDREGRPRWRWLLVAVGCFVCSLLSKALGLMLPVVLFAIDVYPLGRFVPGRRGRILLEKLPFFLAALAEGLLTYKAIGTVGLVRSAEHFGLIARLEEAGYGLCFYLLKTVAPIHLSPLYPVPRPFDPWATFLWTAVLGVVAITAGLLRLRRRAPGLLVAWVCYAVLLLPVLSLINEAPHITADRYSYLACLPWAVLLAWILERRAEAGASAGGVPFYRQPPAVAAAAGLLVLGLLSFLQARIWKDSIALWNQAIRVNPANTYAYNNRGIARSALQDRAGALADFSDAIRLDPSFVEAFHNRGRIRSDTGDQDGAIADESEAIRLNPDYAQAYRGRGLARQAKGDASGAKEDLARASKIEADLPAQTGSLGGVESPFGPTDAAQVQALNNEGNVLATKGDFTGAIAKYTQALGLDARISGIYNNRGNARASKGDQTGAIADYTEAIRLNPRFAEAFLHRGLSRALLKDLRGAIEDYTEALELNSRDAESFANRGMARGLLGDLEGAEEDYSASLVLSPRDPEVYADRGVVRAKRHDVAGAIQDFEASLAVAPPGWPKTSVVRSLLARLQRR